MLLLAVFNVNLVYVLYHGFVSQLLFQGIFLLTLIFFMSLLDSDSKDRKKYIIILGLLIASSFNIYSEGLAFIILPVALYFIYKAFQNPKAAKNLVLPLVLMSLIAVIINPLSFFYAIKTVMSQATVVAGFSGTSFNLAVPLIGAKLNDLWYELETWPNVGSMRWIQPGGGIEIQSSKKQTLVMKFNAISINGSQALNIYNNGLLVKTVTVMDGRLQNFSIPLTISEANNSIIFKVDNEVKPHSTSDPRLLSIAFGKIGFSEEYRP